MYHYDVSVILIFIVISNLLVSGMRLHIMQAHKACMSGNLKYHMRKGWRTRCLSNANPAIKTASPIYTVSGVSNAVSKSRSTIKFGPSLANGHPSRIEYNTVLGKESISVSFPVNESIFIEATDFRVEYNIQIRTPDPHSAACYKLLNAKSKNITLVRDAKC